MDHSHLDDFFEVISFQYWSELISTSLLIGVLPSEVSAESS